MLKTDAAKCLAWSMEKKRIIKEDGRYLIYYRFVPIRSDVDETRREDTLPSKKEKA